MGNFLMTNFDYNYDRNPYYYAFEVWKFFFEQKNIKVNNSVFKHFTARFISRMKPENSTDYFNFLESLEKAILKASKRVEKKTDIKIVLKSGATIVMSIEPWKNDKNIVSLITVY
jgi:hypothetical protein